MRGRSPAPSVIKQHLLTCDDCVREALVEYELIDKLRAGLANRIRRTKEDAFGSVLTPKLPIVAFGVPGEGQYVWAALVPMALAVGLMLSAHTRVDEQRATMHASARSVS